MTEINYDPRQAQGEISKDESVGQPQSPLMEALEHALVRFECLEDHFKETGDEAMWAMSSVDADRMRKALADTRPDRKCK